MFLCSLSSFGSGTLDFFAIPADGELVLTVKLSDSIAEIMQGGADLVGLKGGQQLVLACLFSQICSSELHFLLFIIDFCITVVALWVGVVGFLHHWVGCCMKRVFHGGLNEDVKKVKNGLHEEQEREPAFAVLKFGGLVCHRRGCRSSMFDKQKTSSHVPSTVTVG